MSLEIRDLSVRYGRATAITGVDLTVPEESVLAVLGPSGCGKSTLLRAIAGLERPSSGSISWDGADLSRVPTHKRGFALMFQDGQLFPGQSVARNVGYPLRIRHEERAVVAARVAELLDLVDLSELADRLPANLSGGERQRVALGVEQHHAVAADAGSAVRSFGDPGGYAVGTAWAEGRPAVFHAWAEAYVNGLGWVAFDVANGISPDERYVRVATGRDYRDAAPVSGIRLGQAQEALAVTITVEQ